MYKIVHDTYRAQRSIVDQGADLVLSSVFCALPLLSEVRLSFRSVLEAHGTVMQVLSVGMVMEEEFYQHHLQVVTSAIRTARSRGIAIDTISLWNFDLPYFPPGPEPDLRTLSESLRWLLEDVKVLRLCDSHCVLELLSHCALGLHRLDMCRVGNPPDSG